MKSMKMIGTVSLALAVAVLLIGIFGVILRGENGLFITQVALAREKEAQRIAANEAVSNLQSAVRKGITSQKEAQKALSAAQDTANAIQEAMVGLHGAETENEIIMLYLSLLEAANKLEGSDAEIEVAGSFQRLIEGDTLPMQSALAKIESAIGDTQNSLAQIMSTVETLFLSALEEELNLAREANQKAVSAWRDASQTLSVLVGHPSATTNFRTLEPGEGTALEQMMLEADYLVEYAGWLNQQSELVMNNGEEALLSASQQSIELSFIETLIIRLSTYYILFTLTGVLLLLIGIVFRFRAESLLSQWKKNPVFSTLIALLVLMLVQTYSMRFTYNSFGEWARFWLDNTFNVLRANTSIGMIALGMTMVIITGGIDLAVGSTLAGVGTVTMILIDTSPRGIFGKIGITGTPALLLGIVGGLVAGALIGALIGLAVTKGRVPPFIITLGIMNIVRSLSQFVTKSYTPKVPTEFTKIANTVIFGQRLLPIIYWLILALVIYVMMKRTRFGRYIYAVGSNERTTRLSGINVERVKFAVYTIMGMLVSIAAVTQVSRLGGMDAASAGNGYELDAIAAVVVGGTSMSGGKGSIAGTVIGVLIIGVMNNLLILLGVDSFLTNAFKGAIVVIAVLMQRKDQGGV